MNKEQKKVLVRILIAAVLWIIAWLLPLEGYYKLIAFLVPYLLIGYDVLWSATRNILHGQVFDENFLMAVASVGAFCVAQYPEAVAVLLFYQIGELFQSLAVGKSRKSIAALMDIRPDFARVLRAGNELTIDPQMVEVGETLIVKPGERIPLDAVITKGETAVDTSALTGESLPCDKRVGDNIISGSINLSGMIEAKVKSSFAESTVSRVLDLVENSSAKKARTEAFITRFAKYYTPCVVISAVLLAVLPPLILKQSFGEWVTRALTFLVVSCPCALVISVPLSFFGGIGGASKSGILIKGANDLEALSKVDTVVFDKTGTLTLGRFEVTAVHAQEMPEAELLDIAALAESYSNHPIALSIIKAHGGHLDKSRVSSIEEISGFGVTAVIDGKKVFVGNDKLMHRAGVHWKDCHLPGTTVHIAADGEYMGHIVISDAIKPDAKEAILALKRNGVQKTIMLTGDNQKNGEAVAKELGLDEAKTQLLPDEKVSAVEALLLEKPKNKTLAFVGDGINDAPVLARADVGIAMGALGSDAAIEAADIVLMDDRLTGLSKAMQISRKTMRIVRQNIVFSLLIKAVVLVLGALGFANMWFAVFADVGVMILAILNAMRALYSQK